MANDLIIELPKSNAIQVFTEPGGIDPYLQKIREEALSHVPDLSTKASRAAIASIAAKVARSKTYLDDPVTFNVHEYNDLSYPLEVFKKMRELYDMQDTLKTLV